MQPNADSSPPDQPIERRLNVHQAAEALGITPEAVRSRIQRGTLAKEKGEDGTVYVRLNADQLRANADEHADRSSSAPDGTVDQSQLVERMASEIEHLREMLALRDEEIRRRDHLLAAALERIPALESPPGTPSEQPQREPPVRVSEEARKDEENEEEPSSEAAGRSWWQRWFGV